jgi:CBS domain-containing protein
MHGMFTARELVFECIAAGGDPSSTKVDQIADRETVTIGADDSVEEVLRTRIDHGVRRLPVIDGRELVGVVSQADVARHLPDDQIARLVEAISSAPANN